MFQYKGYVPISKLSAVDEQRYCGPGGRAESALPLTPFSFHL